MIKVLVTRASELTKEIAPCEGAIRIKVPYNSPPPHSHSPLFSDCWLMEFESADAVLEWVGKINDSGVVLSRSKYHSGNFEATIYDDYIE